MAIFLRDTKNPQKSGFQGNPGFQGYPEVQGYPGYGEVPGYNTFGSNARSVNEMKYM